MIKTLLLICFPLLVFSGEVYYVTFVKGDVILKSTGKKLVTGMQVTESDQLVFSDRNAKISCISPARGRFEVTPHNASSKKQNEWVSLVKEAIIPASPAVKLSTRSLFAEQFDPEKIFPRGRVLLLENEPVAIDGKYPLAGSSFFFVQYVSEGQTIVKKVPAMGQAIHFNTALFTDNAGHPPATPLPEVSLCFQENIDGVKRSRIITKFIPVIGNKQVLKEQYALMQLHLKAAKRTEKEILEEALAHFNENYGYIDANIFEKAIK